MDKKGEIKSEIVKKEDVECSGKPGFFEKSEISRYKCETTIYKVIYDKYFRKNRYNHILRSLSGEKPMGVEELKTNLSKKYSFFVGKPIMPKREPNESEEEYNIVNNYMKTTRNIYFCDVFAFFYATQYMVLLFFALRYNYYRRNLALLFISPGLFTSGYAVYQRRLHVFKYEKYLIPKYQPQLVQYSKIFPPKR
jgi:hypothetical protein